MGPRDKIELGLLACSRTPEQKVQLVGEAVVQTNGYPEEGWSLPKELIATQGITRIFVGRSYQREADFAEVEFENVAQEKRAKNQVWLRVREILYM